MPISFYIFLIPLLIAIVFVLYKFVVVKYFHLDKNISTEFPKVLVTEETVVTTNSAEVSLVETSILVAENSQSKIDNIAEAKETIFVFFDNLKSESATFFNFLFHWLLHFFVLFLKFNSIYTDRLYARTRDFFLYTATREKEVVSTFWHHLKEYKKEKEAEGN